MLWHDQVGNDYPQGGGIALPKSKEEKVIEEIEKTEAKSETESSEAAPISSDTEISYDDTEITKKAEEVGLTKTGYYYEVYEG